MFRFKLLEQKFQYSKKNKNVTLKLGLSLDVLLPQAYNKNIYSYIFGINFMRQDGACENKCGLQYML